MMRKHFIFLDKLKIAYYYSGQGPVLIILHGWGISSDYFLELQKYLSENFTVYNIDFPGFGLSSLPVKPYSVSDYAEVLQQFISKVIPKDYYLLAHSFGGRIAIKLASENPKSLNGLILTGSAGLKPKLQIKRICFLIIAQIGKFLIKLPLISKFSHKFRILLYKAIRVSDYVKLDTDVMKETFKLVIAEDLAPYLDKIKVKTLLLWGKDDKLTPLRDGQYMNKKIKNSQLVVFDSVGHRLPYAKPKEVAKKVSEWLKI